MIINIIIVILYLSFLIELFIWPVSSEASTGRLMGKWRSNSIKQNIIYILIFIFQFVFVLTPLFLSLYSIITSCKYEINTLTFPGIILGWTGRFISIAGARILHQNSENQLITSSLFKWSRNPISLGLFTTFLGLVLVFPFPIVRFGWIIFVFNLNVKVNMEEKFLKEKFGIPYILYKKTTPKYLLV